MTIQRNPFFGYANVKSCVARLWPALVAMLLVAVSFGQGDRTVAIAVQGLPQPVADAAAMISVIMEPVFLLPACLLLSVAASVRPGDVQLSRYGLFSFSCASASLAVALVLKHAIGRARPEVGLNLDPFLFHPFAFADSYAALPSAQAACAAAVFIAAAMRFPGLRLPFHLCAVVLCGARVLTGEHWVSDVAAGWAIGWSAVFTLSGLALLGDGPDRD